ncbi:hypothetical protein BD310DRAFT_970853 [Dichomitus squalens]|uniref:Uncharacterized protein n=1 Tax=Dichomitus squalens TaxID=114155 RepID=A0A4Q9PC58_9APHY|nr:hypothetical protein BD310DRAFT_970853 [Dichomitus squalens]
MPAYTEARQTTNSAFLSRRGWYRTHFYDHPGYIENDAKALYGDKVKVWCKPCFQRRVANEQREDSFQCTRINHDRPPNAAWSAHPHEPCRASFASARREYPQQYVKVRLKRHFGDRTTVPLVQNSAESEATHLQSLEGSTSCTGSLRGTASHGAFGDLVRQHQSEDTDSEDDPIFPSVIKIKLELLFDFSCHYWQKRREDSDMTASLDEELEVWNILDMDADGEPATETSETIDGAWGNQPDAFTSAVLGI